MSKLFQLSDEPIKVLSAWIYHSGTGHPLEKFAELYRLPDWELKGKQIVFGEKTLEELIPWDSELVLGLTLAANISDPSLMRVTMYQRFRHAALSYAKNQVMSATVSVRGMRQKGTLVGFGDREYFCRVLIDDREIQTNLRSVLIL